MALNKRNNPRPDALSGVEEVNYKFACRCCLKADAEFVKLESVSVARSLDGASEGDQISLLRCLIFCVRADNSPELPQYICVECSKSLQVAYYFLQNAMRAHEILCRKLCPGKSSAEGKRFNGTIGQRFQLSPALQEVCVGKEEGPGCDALGLHRLSLCLLSVCGGHVGGQDEASKELQTRVPGVRRDHPQSHGAQAAHPSARRYSCWPASHVLCLMLGKPHILSLYFRGNLLLQLQDVQLYHAQAAPAAGTLSLRSRHDPQSGGGARQSESTADIPS